MMLFTLSSVTEKAVSKNPFTTSEEGVRTTVFRRRFIKALLTLVILEALLGALCMPVPEEEEPSLACPSEDSFA
jgi:hypothetical protein